MKELRSRRRILRQVGASLAISALETKGAPAQKPLPEIQLDLSINLDRDDVYAFLSGSKTDQTFGPVLTDAEKGNYVELSRKTAGTMQLPDPTAKAGTPFASGPLTAKKLRYSVRKRKVVIGEVTAIDIYAHPIQVTVESVLLVTQNVAKNSTMADRVKKAFDTYNPGTDPDPFKYATQKMGSDIDATMFMVRASFTLHKTAAPVAVQKQSDSIKDLFSGKLKVVIYDSTYPTLGPYLENEGIDLVGPKEEDLDRVPKPETNAHMKEIPKPATQAEEDQAANDIISGIVSTAKPGCELNQRDTVRIAAIFGWPEFKIDWVDVKIKVGCFWVIFSLPIPRIRFSDLVLFAYVAHDNIGKLALNIVMGCLSRSAVAGAVIGVVAGNLAGALAVFEALFEECVAEKVVCAAPGLALVVESSSWS